MVTPEIISYIRSQLANTIPQDVIQSRLVQSGWQSQDILEAFHQILHPSDPHPQVEIQPKSKIIGLLSGLFFFLSFASFWYVAQAILMINTLNAGVSKANLGALPYSILKTMPFLGPIALLESVPIFVYLFLAFKVRSRSKEAWKTSIITVSVLLVYQITLSFITTLLLSKFSSV